MHDAFHEQTLNFAVNYQYENSDIIQDSPTRFCSAPVTTRLRVLLESSRRVGYITTSPSIRPTRTDPTGPLQGISETAKAAEAVDDAKKNKFTITCINYNFFYIYHHHYLTLEVLVFSSFILYHLTTDKILIPFNFFFIIKESNKNYIFTQVNLSLGHISTE